MTHSRVPADFLPVHLGHPRRETSGNHAPHLRLPGFRDLPIRPHQIPRQTGFLLRCEIGLYSRPLPTDPPPAVATMRGRRSHVLPSQARSAVADKGCRPRKRVKIGN